MNSFLYRVRWLVIVTALLSYLVAAKVLLGDDTWVAAMGVTVGSSVAVFLSVVQMRHHRTALRRLLPAVQPPPREDAVLTLEIYQATPQALGLTAFGYGVIAPTGQLVTLLRQATDVIAKGGQEGLSSFPLADMTEPVDNPVDRPVDE